MSSTSAGPCLLIASLRLMRLDRGISQEQIAEALGVDRKTVNRWETGRHLDVPLPRVMDYAAYLGLRLVIEEVKPCAIRSSGGT